MKDFLDIAAFPITSNLSDKTFLRRESTFQSQTTDTFPFCWLDFCCFRCCKKPQIFHLLWFLIAAIFGPISTADTGFIHTKEKKNSIHLLMHSLQKDYVSLCLKDLRALIIFVCRNTVVQMKAVLALVCRNWSLIAFLLSWKSFLLDWFVIWITIFPFLVCVYWISLTIMSKCHSWYR